MTVSTGCVARPLEGQEFSGCHREVPAVFTMLFGKSSKHLGAFLIEIFQKMRADIAPVFIAMGAQVAVHCLAAHIEISLDQMGCSAQLVDTQVGITAKS